MSGQRRKGKLSDFGVQLRAKQKLKGYYGDLREKQFRATYEEANRRKGDTSENLIGLLESRLDAIVYRAKFAPTIFAARQIVSRRMRWLESASKLGISKPCRQASQPKKARSK